MLFHHLQSVIVLDSYVKCWVQALPKLVEMLRVKY